MTISIGTIDLDAYLGTGIAVPVLASTSMWISKTPVLLLYVRIFGVYRWMRIASYALLVTSGIGLLLAMVPTWQDCHPLDNELTALKWKACGRAVLTAGVAQGAISVTADLLILLLPLYPIARLNLSARRKVGLGIVFCSGVFGVLASLLALLYKIHLYQGAQSDKGGMLTTMLLQFVECAIALMVGCVPSARGYWVGHILPSRFYTSVASFGTRLLAPSTWGTRRSTRSNTSYRETKYADNFGDHERQMGGASSEEYIRMEAGVNNHSRNPST
ncbi:hypothetical protein KJ359_004506 [Pestalotiopsis sp. 9143b]|nr:hypothetical protein KJ359_004506 [Pestalotiopsis sp. 9143b]